MFIWIILSSLAAVYMAFVLGGNDAANAVATSVGSKAIDYKKGVIIAAISNLIGALLVGGHVTQTIGKDIVKIEYFVQYRNLFILGMFSSLFSAGLWVQIATQFGMPISTTHSIVGAVIGFGLFAGGISYVYWLKILKIFLSWVISPILGAIVAFFIFNFVRLLILDAKDPFLNAKKYGPILSSFVFIIITFSTIYKGLKLNVPFFQSVIISISFAFFGYIITWSFLKEREEKNGVYSKVEKLFGVLQLLTATYMGFAHGANDVANAIGPAAAIYSVMKGAGKEFFIPIWLLFFGGFGLALGTALFGYKVIKTVGEEVTDITPTRGFSAEFAAATTVLIFSKLGLPISTTHTVVGAVIGVGIARGMASLNLGVIRNIILSWMFTVPVSAILSGIIFSILKIFLTL